jgi:hypothetical protein
MVVLSLLFLEKKGLWKEDGESMILKPQISQITQI